MLEDVGFETVEVAGVAKQRLTRTQWAACHRRALRRAAIVLNPQHFGAEAQGLLRLNDLELERVLRQAGSPDDLLFQLKTETLHGPADYDGAFYGRLGVRRRGLPDGSFLYRVVQTITDLFLDTCYESQVYDGYDHVRLGFSSEEPFFNRAITMGTNYLLKNLWHNAVHALVQNISAEEYPNLRGTARYASDFDADALAAVLLAHSYGHRVECVSISAPDAYDPGLPPLWRRNRCNMVFGRRAEMRDGEGGASLSTVEREWIFRRVIAVYISGWLIATGRACSSVSVHISDRSVSERERRVIVEVNGLYIDTDRHFYYDAEILDPRAHRRLRKRFEYISSFVDEQYLNCLKRLGSGASGYAEGPVDSKLALVGIKRWPAVAPRGLMTEGPAAVQRETGDLGDG